MQENAEIALQSAMPAPPAPLDTITPERFIPVDRSAILEALTSPNLWAPGEIEMARSVLHYMARIRQQDSCLSLDRLTQLYDYFNPDDETVDPPDEAARDKTAELNMLIESLKRLVESANFESINEKQLEKILTETSPDGVDVDVDLSEFDFTLLYSRGLTKETRERRDWDTLFRKKQYEVDVYRRLFIAVKLKPHEKRIAEIMQKENIPREKAEKRLKKLRERLPKNMSPEHIYLKIFKHIPQKDLEMLFPNSKIKLKYWDKVRLWITAGGGTVAGFVTAIIKIVTAAVLSPILLIMSLFGLGGVIFRQIMSLINTRNRYMMQLAQSLYFSNLANNQSAIALLIDEAEEEDIKEELLLYTSVLKSAVTPGQLQRVKADIEEFIRYHWNVHIDFDANDALQRLLASGLMTREGGETYRALSLGEAKSLLAYRWRMSLEDGLPKSVAA